MKEWKSGEGEGEGKDGVSVCSVFRARALGACVFDSLKYLSELNHVYTALTTNRLRYLDA